MDKCGHHIGGHLGQASLISFASKPGAELRLHLSFSELRPIAPVTALTLVNIRRQGARCLATLFTLRLPWQRHPFVRLQKGEASLSHELLSFVCLTNAVAVNTGSLVV